MMLSNLACSWRSDALAMAGSSWLTSIAKLFFNAFVRTSKIFSAWAAALFKVKLLAMGLSISANAPFKSICICLACCSFFCLYSFNALLRSFGVPSV